MEWLNEMKGKYLNKNYINNNELNCKPIFIYLDLSLHNQYLQLQI